MLHLESLEKKGENPIKWFRSTEYSVQEILNSDQRNLLIFLSRGSYVCFASEQHVKEAF